MGMYDSEVDELNDIFNDLGTSHWNQKSLSSERLFKSQDMSGILFPKILQWSSAIKLFLMKEDINIKFLLKTRLFYPF